MKFQHPASAECVPMKAMASHVGYVADEVSSSHHKMNVSSSLQQSSLTINIHTCSMQQQGGGLTSTVTDVGSAGGMPRTVTASRSGHEALLEQAGLAPCALGQYSTRAPDPAAMSWRAVNAR